MFTRIPLIRKDEYATLNLVDVVTNNQSLVSRDLQSE
jgi:hypothetical protein